MKYTLKHIAIAITLAISPACFAEDFVPQDNSPVTASQESAPVSNVQESAPALEAMTEATQKPFKQEAPVEEVYVSAEEQVQNYMETKGWTDGWSADKKRMFVVYSETFNTEDPSYDDSFVTKRSQFALIASMEAKAKIVEFMRTQMSAVDQINAPGTDVHAQLNAQYNKAMKKIAAQQKVLVKLLAEVDAAEADKLAGASWEALTKRMYEGAIAKLDAAYSAGDIEAKNIAKYKKAKQRYDAAVLAIEKIEAKAEAIKGTVSLESKSMVETLAKAPIMGASTLLQAESWNADKEEYEVAILMVWSPKLEKAAQAIVTGASFPLKPKKALSVHDWLKTQELSTMVGPRQYVDKNGERWFLGAYAMPIDGSASLKRKNKGIADLFAKKETAMALYADLETQKKAEIEMQTRSAEDFKGKDNTAVATSFAEKTKQSIENRPVSGLSKILSKTIVHPISNQEIYLVVYGISGNSAREALKMERSAFGSAGKANQAIAVSNANRKTLENDLKKSANKKENSNKSAVAKKSIKQAIKQKSQRKTSSNSLLNAPEIDEDDF